MREIKFRVINTKTKEWLHKPGEEVNLFGEQILMGGFMSSVSIPDLDDYLPLQLTGVKDKNGKEIYEGDIVKLMGQNHIVVYDPAIFRLADSEGRFTTSGYPDWDFCEVIGNIYENPELVKQ